MLGDFTVTHNTGKTYQTLAAAACTPNAPVIGAGNAGGDPETVAVIGGTGDLGTGLASRWAKAGYDLVIVETPGGGGHGDPRRRKTVAEDVANGKVSAEAAGKLYGWSKV